MQDSERVAALLSPVDDVVRAGLDRLGVAALPVDIAEVDGFYHLDEALHLSAALEGPGLHHPAEPVGPAPMDRWRRAAASVLEAAVLASLPEGPAWLRLGLALHRVDRAVPALRLAEADLQAAGAGDLTARPRGGLAVLRAWEVLGRDADAIAHEALSRGHLGTRDFLDAARVILTGGLAAAAPGLVRPCAVDVPTALGPWSWARLEVPAHPRGGRVRVVGRGGCSPAWAAADTVLEAVAVACEAGAELVPDVGGPTGRWEVRSATGFGNVFGARGVTFVFQPSGRFEVVLADAFVGSVLDREAAERVGTSGTASGRWTVQGAHALRLHDVVPVGVTVHGRDASPFVIPAEGVGMAGQLRALADAPWSWAVDDDRLTLEGRMMGGSVTLGLARV
ncbi:MAG: hypothetical protein H6733_05615 [Alphaproteobacteria bacterium]|nr:hypothetical protein [Alphaproteobacteria bacterium]